MNFLFYGVIALLVGIVVFLAFRVVKEVDAKVKIKREFKQYKTMQEEVNGDLEHTVKRLVAQEKKTLEAESQLALTKITLESIMSSTHDAMTREYVRTQLKKLQ